jgi:hypothetical protein
MEASDQKQEDSKKQSNEQTQLAHKTAEQVSDEDYKIEPTSTDRKHLNTNSGKDIVRDSLEPVTKVKSNLDKELQEWEVESTKDGRDLNR